MVLGDVLLELHLIVKAKKVFVFRGWEGTAVADGCDSSVARAAPTAGGQIASIGG